MESFLIGYFDGAAGEHFQELRRFDVESDARHYVEVNYTADAEGQPQNIAIMQGSRIVYDGRIVGLN